MKRPLGKIAAALMVLFGFALGTTSLRAQGNFVYTLDDTFGPNTVSGFSVASNGTLTSVPGSPFATGGVGDGHDFLRSNLITVGNVGNFLFASNTGSNDVSVFSINAGTGALSLVAGSPFAAGGFVRGTAPTPDGRFLIVNNLTVFSIASSGALTPIAGSPFPLLSTPGGIKVSPDGKFLAVAEPFSNRVEMFSIASNGSLTSLGAFPGGGGNFLVGVDINCAASLLYGGEATPPTPPLGTIVDGYSIASNGILTPVPGSPFRPGVGVDSEVVLLSPDDKTLFVSNQSSNTITVFSVASNGSLSLVAGSPFPNHPPGFIPFRMATSQDGSLLYVVNFPGTISVFSVAGNGALTEVAGSPFPGGQSTQSLTAFPPKSCVVQTPTITSISPTSAIAGGAAFTLTVNGTNFVSGSTVSFNGSARTTTFASATQVTAAILASDIATPGSFSVAVTNPAPGGGTSNAVTFTVNNPVPTITSLSPSSAVAGLPAFLGILLTVNGTGFVSGSTVNFNGKAQTTTFVSAMQLGATIFGFDIATAGTFSVTVTNPSPGGGTSNAVTFTVVTPEQAAQTIINSVNALFSQGVINGGQDNSLIVQLQHAIAMMSAGKNNGAIGNLNSFITEVNDLLSSGALSPSQATSLISAAESVIAALS